MFKNFPKNVFLDSDFDENSLTPEFQSRSRSGKTRWLSLSLFLIYNSHIFVYYYIFLYYHINHVTAFSQKIWVCHEFFKSVGGQNPILHGGPPKNCLKNWDPQNMLKIFRLIKYSFFFLKMSIFFLKNWTGNAGYWS